METEKTSDNVNIQIPKPLAEKIGQRMKGTDFSTVSDYVIYVLEQVLAKVEQEKEEGYVSEDEEEEVKERLKKLGYL